MFVGETVKHKKDNDLQLAKELAEQGISYAEIGQRTGCYYFGDERWRVEMDDSDLELSDTFLNMLRHGELQHLNVQKIGIDRTSEDTVDLFYFGYNESGQISQAIDNVSISDLPRYLGENTMVSDLRIPEKIGESDLLTVEEFFFEGAPSTLPIPLCFNDSYLSNISPQLYAVMFDINEPLSEQSNAAVTIHANGYTTINVKNDGSRNLIDIQESLLHEVQHIFQRIGDLDQGSDPSMYKDIDAFYHKNINEQLEMKCKVMSKPDLWDKLMSHEVFVHKLKGEYPSIEGFLDFDAMPESVQDDYFERSDELFDRFDEHGIDLSDYVSAQYPIFKVDNSETYSALYQYMRTFGEIEARVTSGRMKLNAEERRSVIPPELIYGQANHHISLPNQLSMFKFNRERRALYGDGDARFTVSESYDTFSTLHFDANSTSREVIRGVIKTAIEAYGALYNELPDGNPIRQEFATLMGTSNLAPEDWVKADYMTRDNVTELLTNMYITHCENTTQFTGLSNFFRSVTESVKRLIHKFPSFNKRPIEAPQEVTRIFNGMIKDATPKREGFQSDFADKILRHTSIMPTDALTMGMFTESVFEVIAEKSGIEFDTLTNRFDIQITGSMNRRKPEFFKL